MNRRRYPNLRAVVASMLDGGQLLSCGHVVKRLSGRYVERRCVRCAREALLPSSSLQGEPEGFTQLLEVLP